MGRHVICSNLKSDMALAYWNICRSGAPCSIVINCLVDIAGRAQYNWPRLEDFASKKLDAVVKGKTRHPKKRNVVQINSAVPQ